MSSAKPDDSATLIVKKCFSSCAICEGQAHGTHFGVPACRACAAFFRRSFVLGRNYKCQRTIGQCNITRETRFSCRGCRLEKCIKAGMTPDNVHFDPSTSESVELNAAKLDRDSRPWFFVAKRSTENIRPFFNTHASDEEKKAVTQELERMTQRVCAIFSAATDPHPVDAPFHLTALQKMTLATQRLRGDHLPNPEYVEAVQLPQHLNDYWQMLLEEMAKWMQQCEAFQSLPLDQKLLIYKCSWCSIMRLDKVFFSISAFGEAALTERKCYLTRDTYINRYTKFDVSSICKLDHDQIVRLISPILNLLFEEVGRPLFAMQATQFEYVYVMCLAMWNVENWGVSESTLRAAESYRERISAELHDYYIHSLRIENYASRLITLIRVVQSNERVQNARGDMIELFRLFDYLNMEFPSGDIFDWRRM